LAKYFLTISGDRRHSLSDLKEVGFCEALAALGPELLSIKKVYSATENYQTLEETDFVIVTASAPIEVIATTHENQWYLRQTKRL
jgi:hypothetical protein